MTKAEIVKKEISRFKKTPSLTLAKKIYAAHPLLFKDVEDARSFVRIYRGQSGVVKRKEITDKSNYKEAGDKNPFKLPESFAKDRTPFKLPLAHNNILVLSDIHAPYHDIEAITIALNYGKEKEVNTIFINGDLLDFFQCSRFEKTPNKRSIKEEFEAAREILQVIRKEFPSAAIYFLKGNHDLRFEKWLYVKAPEIFDCEEFQLEYLLRLKDLNIKIIEDNVLVKFGKLNVSHGHYVIKGIFAPVNSARGAYMKAKASILIGHTHSVSAHTERTINGEIISCWSTGCLCETKTDYDPLNAKASHGFARVVVEKNGDYHVENKMIYKGKLF